jgi:hypothetical protein
MGFVADLQQLGEQSEPAAADPYAALAEPEDVQPGDPAPTDVYAALSEVNPRYSGLVERSAVSSTARARSAFVRSAFARPDMSPTSGGPVTGSAPADSPAPERDSSSSSWASSDDADTAPRPIVRPRAGGSAAQPAAAVTPAPAASPSPAAAATRPLAPAAFPLPAAMAGAVGGAIVRHGMPAAPTVVGRAEPAAVAEPIDITPGMTRPGQAAAGGGSRRRLRVGLMAGAGATLAALIAGGVGYAALTKPGPPIAALDPAVPVPGSRSGEPSAAGPVSAPHAASGLTHTGRPTPGSITVTTPPAGRPVTKLPLVVRTIVPPATKPAPPPRPTPTPPAPTWTDPQPGGAPAGGHPAGDGNRALTATLTPSGDGLDFYSAVIEVDNPARRPAYSWQLTLTVPGGNQVSADGAAVTQDGSEVTFRPYDGTAVAAGGSVMFTFTVHGLLPAAPYDCAIDGKACY